MSTAAERPVAEVLAAVRQQGRVELQSPQELLRLRLPTGIRARAVNSDLLRLIGPAALEFALLQFVNMFDQIQVGGLGESALAAIGLSTQIKLLFITAFVAVNIGVTAMTARAVGEQKAEEPSKVLRHGLLLTLVLTIPFVALGVIFTDEVLLLFGVPDLKTMAYAADYLRICLLGFLPVSLTMTITAALRGIGDTKTPLYYSVLANVLNVALNWVLINGNLGFPRLEVRGAAIATVVGQGVAFLIACRVCTNPKRSLFIPVRAFFSRLESRCMRRILSIGLPSMGEQLIVRLGISLFTIVVTGMGTTLYAAHTVCISIQSLTFMSGMAFSVASTTLSAQSLGAGRCDMAVLYCWYCAKLSMLFSVALIVLYAGFGPAMISLYNPDPAIIAAGTVPLQIVAIIQPFAAMQYVFSGAMRGAGDTRAVALITILTMFICRPLLAYCAVNLLHLGLNGAWWALMFDQTLCAVLMCLRFISCKWMYALQRK